MTQLTFTLDPDELDDLVALELRKCYTSLADPINTMHFKERKPTMEALLVVLEHYMIQSEFEEWYETIKDL